MTDAEKQAASRGGPEAEAALARHAANGEVARVIGWTELETLNTGQVAGIPPGGGYWQGIPDLFAPTPAGAWAREQARIWLIEHGWRLHVEHYAGEFGVQWTLTSDTFIERDGAAMIDAEASAIHAAVVALGAGEGES